jgi:putative spermidine/putrescine transport system ATP-binding protein
LHAAVGEADIGAAVNRALSDRAIAGTRHPLPARNSRRPAAARRWRAIVYRPSIILMDEPLGALDKKLREEMQLRNHCTPS